MVQSYLAGGANVNPHLTYASLDKPQSISKWHFDRFSHFCTAHGRESLYFTMGRPCPHQNCPFTWGSGLPSNTWFLGPAGVHNPNGISIGSVVVAGLTITTDRQTDYATLVTTGHIYIHTTAMQPKNVTQNLQHGIRLPCGDGCMISSLI